MEIGKHALANEKKAETKAALESMLEAVMNTKTYLARLRENPANRSLDVQSHLAQLWAKAGTDMYPIDDDLAVRYVMKADYLSDPDGWDARRNDKTLIELEEIFRLGREVLRK